MTPVLKTLRQKAADIQARLTSGHYETDAERLLVARLSSLLQAGEDAHVYVSWRTTATNIIFGVGIRRADGTVEWPGAHKRTTVELANGQVVKMVRGMDEQSRQAAFKALVASLGLNEAVVAMVIGMMVKRFDVPEWLVIRELAEAVRRIEAARAGEPLESSAGP